MQLDSKNNIYINKPRRTNKSTEMNKVGEIKQAEKNINQKRKGITKQEQGITLLALVITIIIIIILATVTINMAFGDNGLIKQAELARDLTANSTGYETQATLNLVSYMNEMLKDSGEISEPDAKLIEFSQPNWIGDGTATLTIMTNNTINELQYQINGTEKDKWTNIKSGEIIEGLQHGSTVYARLWDGQTELYINQMNVQDTVPPKVEISTSNITESSATLTVTAVDEQSGLTDNNRYTYYLGEEQKVANNTNSYNYTGLAEGTNYELKVEVTDKAGLTTEKVTTIKTLEKQGTMASEVAQNASTYYGKEVIGYTCQNQGVSKWRIFYADESNIYLIADDYISYQYAPDGKGGRKIYRNTDYKLSFNNVISDYSEGSSWIKTNSKGAKWLSQYLNTYASTYNNIKAVAYMMDTNVWSGYVGEDAEYAMGGPTLEMFCESYKDTHQNRYIECKASSNIGYQIRWNDGTYDTSVEGLTQNDFNGIYIKLDTGKAIGMWLASPSANDTSYIVYAHYNGNLYSNDYFRNNPGLRPLVCLKTEVKLEDNGNGTYSIGR